MADCEHCPDHSGVVVKLEEGEKRMTRLDTFMEDQTKRAYQILVGIILCLIASMGSLIISLVSQPQIASLDCFTQTTKVWAGGEPTGIIFPEVKDDRFWLYNKEEVKQ